MTYHSDWGRVVDSLKLALAGAVVAGVMAMSAPADAATTVEPKFGSPTINGNNNFTIGDIFTVEISGLDGDGSGGFFMGFTALTDLVALETNTFNPIDGFDDPFLEWREFSNGTGQQYAFLDSGTLLSGNTAMSIPFALGETKYLIASWNDINADGANWDIRISAVPLPAGLVLFLSGLAGIGFLGRYKAKRQAPAPA